MQENMSSLKQIAQAFVHKVSASSSEWIGDKPACEPLHGQTWQNMKSQSTTIEQQWLRSSMAFNWLMTFFQAIDIAPVIAWNYIYLDMIL